MDQQFGLGVQLAGSCSFLPGISQLQLSGMAAETGGSRIASLMHLGLALARDGAALSIRSLILMETVQ